ncbi:tape measure protein [Salmonella phage 19]|nr:tape measure protein [Salmonella phage 19]
MASDVCQYDDVEPDLMLSGAKRDCDFNLVEIYDWFLSIPDQKEGRCAF